MTIYEILTIAVISVLAAATVVAFYYGLLGMAGLSFVVRCAGCGHLTVATSDRAPAGCPHCSARLTHHVVHEPR